MTEFEESEFRGPLFNQLERESNLLWEPGQVFEKSIGIDRASMCVKEYLWNLHGFSSPLGGTVLRNRDFKSIFGKTKPKKKLPDFGLNLFTQAKRSEYSSRAKEKLKPKIKGAHWYFEITPHQQKALEVLEKELLDDALVIYAAPVFHREQELYNHTTNQTIVENSTFPKVSMLNGHTKWYFDTGGIVGVANPEYESFDEGNLLDHVQEMRNQKGDYDSESFVENLIKLSKAINNVVKSQSESFLASRFAGGKTFINHFLDIHDLRGRKGIKEYMQIELFSYLWKLNWLTF